MGNEALEAMLNSRRAFTVAAAGCGKTELLGQLVADPRSGRQLVLTHTHAGVAAIRKRLAKLRVPSEKFHLDTVDGWSLRFGAAYPGISGFRNDPGATPDWASIAEKVCRTSLGRRVVSASYDGVLVDEYQDCSLKKHALIQALGECIPCRGVGDPLQSVFGFDDDPIVNWDRIRADFDVLDTTLCEPWRWRRPGHNTHLGDWLLEARTQLNTTGRLIIGPAAPVTWVEQRDDDAGARSNVCRGMQSKRDTMVAIVQWPRSAVPLAQRLQGRWPIIERFDEPELPKLSATLVSAAGPSVVEELVTFVAARMTGVGTELKRIVEAIKTGRGVSRFTTNLEHATQLAALAATPTPANALVWLEGVLSAKRENWWLYRRESAFQLRAALRECTRSDFSELPQAVAAARTRARHRGRETYRRSIGTPLLVKGLEFEHAVLLWDPDLSVAGLYVALTRASKTLTVLSPSRTLVPKAR